MKLILVGAGPGDPDLITLKGLKTLQGAKVVLYDALAQYGLLDHCPADCIRVNVGKRFNQHSCRQDDINTLILSYLREFGEVVRLKGGDPFIFGRGQEEIDFVRPYGVETEVIPGISSSYSAPALAGIPLTTRGLSESFWVITGTTRNHELSHDLYLAARSTATVVVLMGMHKLPEIVELYKELGLGSQAIAIIQNGSLPTQKQVGGTMLNILSKAQEAAIGSPAVIVIGEVARLLQPEKLSVLIQDLNIS